MSIPNNHEFKLKSDFDPAGDQPQAIIDLIEGINKKEKDQVLMGVTGSGKTFTTVSYTHLTLPTNREV